jgi:alpha-tubulin suppressor-like RCC1 family protein
MRIGTSRGVSPGPLRTVAIQAVLISLAGSLATTGLASQAALGATYEAISVSAGVDQSCALESGKAYCWGPNYYGQLGDGSTSPGYSVPVPVDVSGVLAGETLTQITAGEDDTCALDAAGTAYCWGNNGSGQLGDGNTTNSSVPVAVNASGALAGKTLTQISGAGYSICAVDAADAAYCWGFNESGQLGDDSTVGSTVPVLAGPRAPTGVTAVPGSTTATVSWTAPASLDGSTLKGYTTTASPGGAPCSTTGATTCRITGLATDTSYSITVVAHTTAGDSGASPLSASPWEAGSRSPVTRR